MVEKLAINNELLKMKKTVAQAKVCVIGKLVKKLRETKKKLESSDTKPLKLTTRPAKLSEQMVYLKRTPNFELATLCLIAEKEPQQVLTNSTSENDELALALLRSFKTIAERVTEIKAKFSLNETDEGWRKSLQEIGKKKQKKNDKEAHQKRKLEQKERATKIKESETKRSEWLSENQKETAPDENENMSVDDQHVVPEINKTKPKAVVKESKKPVVQMKDKKSEKKDMPQINKKEILKEPKIAYVAPTPKRQLDSFFVTDSGSAYLATSEFEERIQPLGPNDGMDRRQRRAQMFGRSTATSYNRPTRKPQPVQVEKKQFSTLTRPSFAVTAMPAAPVPSDLHPSWAAKQKNKVIANFQGRKTTFTDDVDCPKQEAPAVAPFVRRTNEGTASKSATADDAPKLHPSWAAKQKFKPVISEFTGKKITFGD